MGVSTFVLIWEWRRALTVDCFVSIVSLRIVSLNKGCKGFRRFLFEFYFGFEIVSRLLTELKEFRLRGRALDCLVEHRLACFVGVCLKVILVLTWRRAFGCIEGVSFGIARGSASLSMGFHGFCSWAFDFRCF